VAAKDERGFEVLRVWIAREDQHVSLRTDVWDDPAAWGLLLVDLSRHVARSYAAAGSLGEEQTLERIREAMLAEWQHPTE
ncbi:MAG: DUF5076 domain-containing protein, partial [Polyangiales bacterium]